MVAVIVVKTKRNVTQINVKPHSFIMKMNVWNVLQDVWNVAKMIWVAANNARQDSIQPRTQPKILWPKSAMPVSITAKPAKMILLAKLALMGTKQTQNSLSAFSSAAILAWRAMKICQTNALVADTATITMKKDWHAQWIWNATLQELANLVQTTMPLRIINALNVSHKIKTVMDAIMMILLNASLAWKVTI